MGSHFWWIYDALVLLIFGYVLHSNYKRGMTKVIILSIGYLIAAFAASLIASFGAKPVYKSVAQSSNISAVETVNEHVNLAQAFSDAINQGGYGFTCTQADIESILRSPEKKPFDHALYEYACRRNNDTIGPENDFQDVLRKTFIKSYGEEMGNRLPRYAQTSFERQVNADVNVMRNIVDALYDKSQSPRETASTIESLFAKQATIEVLRIFLYLIVLSILMVIVAIINSIAQNKLFFNLSNFREHIYGGVFGILEAGVMLILMTIVVRLLVLLGGGKIFCFSNDTINKSVIFKYLYNHLSTLL